MQSSTTSPPVETLQAQRADVVPDHPFLRALCRGLIRGAAFFFATGIFISIAKSLDFFPDTAPVAAGRVIAEDGSKLREYVTALLYMTLVPLGAFVLERTGHRVHARLARPLLSVARDRRDGLIALSTALFSAPLYFSPVLYLVTRKELWSVPLPVVLSLAGPFVLGAIETKRWLRDLIDPRSNGTIHAL
ncbi:MAG TPA: hypothetical protein VM534_07805, partial [Thermoanaerobaculia bacterium]|nr:hypothetical protein [Thermoanaerobaculia bacterium]